MQNHVQVPGTRPVDFGHITLSDIIDAPALREMLTDYHVLTGILVGILDLDGRVLVGIGWQDICVQFHRVQPEACRFCHESDTALSSGVAPGTFKVYRCKNNLWDIATPIMLGTRHIGNIFLGQFLYDDEELDYEQFRSQAKRYGFDEAAYLAALDRVPRFSKETVTTAMSFYSKLAQMISKSNYSNVMLAETLTRSRQYEKELLEKNAQLERFTYTVSHDLKSPLITVQSFVGTIRQDLEAGRHGRAEDDLRRVASAAAKMTALLDDLLKLSRVGKQMHPPSRVDMNEVVQDVLAQLAGLLGQRHVEVAVLGELPAIQGDRHRMEEVLQNLVENAVKYMGDQPEPRIEIGFRDEQGKDVFSVQDNGIGIEQRYHQNVFGLFNKLDAKSEGTGVGLALVKQIIEVHGGRVWVESQGAGTGSRFCFTLEGQA